jgi:hypothetical protein
MANNLTTELTQLTANNTANIQLNGTLERNTCSHMFPSSPPLGTIYREKGTNQASIMKGREVNGRASSVRPSLSVPWD